MTKISKQNSVLTDKLKPFPTTTPSNSYLPNLFCSLLPDEGPLISDAESDISMEGSKDTLYLSLL